MLKNKLIFIIFALFVFNCLPDEKNWQEQRFEGVRFQRVNKINNQYILFGKNDLSKAVFYISLDGQSWQSYSTSIEADTFYYYNNEYLLLKTDYNNSRIYRSADLLSWFETIVYFSISGISFDGARYIGYLNSVSSFPKEIIQSTDLLNWSEPKSFNIDISLFYITYLNNKFYAPGYFNTYFTVNAVFVSDDALNWSEIPEFHGLPSIWETEYLSNELIFTGDNGTIFKKENGHWINHSVLFGPDFSSVARGRNEFLFASGFPSGSEPVLWSTDDFFIWKESKHDLKKHDGGLTLSDDYSVWYSGVFYTGDFYIVTANECLNGECEGIILTAE
jgi:hypothetical protein